MHSILVYGAGSIGNHLSHAARRAGWSVTVCDIDQVALDRMKNDIYPTRYGAWDDAIAQVRGPYVPEEGMFDVVAIGTPPDSHMTLARELIAVAPKILHIEKVLATPLDDMDAFEALLAKHKEVMATVGYDHAIAPSISYVAERIQSGSLGDILSIDSRTLEHWGGIFGAHPWLAGPHESYLGFWKRGGGALCEHSHAFHLGLHFARCAGWGSGELLHCHAQIVRGEHGTEYDRRSDVSIQFGEHMLSVTQDVITKPTRKEVWVQGSEGRVEVTLSGPLDVVTETLGSETTKKEFTKTRPDDFFALMKHYEKLLSGEVSIADSPVAVNTGIEVMRYIREVLV